MTSEELKKRTKQFSLSVAALDEALPRKRSGEIIFRQLLSAATSVGANYRSACKARSRADFISKISIVEEEADECQYWLELIVESKLCKQELILPLLDEARELTTIFTASGKTAKHNR